MQADHLDDLPAHPVEGMEAGQRILEDHPDLRAADGLHLIGLHREQVPPLEQRLARYPRPAGEPHDRLGRYALAGSRLADDAQGLSPVDMEGHPAHRLHDAVVGTERHVQVLDFK